MGSLTIRNLDDALKTSLRIRAARHGRSMEEEVRVILRGALESSTGESLGEAVRGLIAPLGGVELETPPRDALRPPPDLSR